MTLPPGTRLGPFEILSAIGAGGMGEVYRAKDTRLGRDAALKVLPRELMSDRERLIRFAQEARSASGLNHPNIVTIYEIGQADGQPFMAMELIDGRTLREVMNEGAMPVRKALEVAAQIADGLAKAHEAHIVHRDLKPENVMVTRDGFAKILDFGLAKLAAPDSSGESPQASMTRTGFVLGTAGYMSPEQASGRPVDFRSDQFGAGLIFYEMLTGRRAFQRATAVQTLSAIIQEEPEPLERLNPRVPPPLRWVIERCLNKDPEERYAATRDLARELRQIRDNLTRLQETPDISTSAPAPAQPTMTLPTPSGGTDATRLHPGTAATAAQPAATTPTEAALPVEAPPTPVRSTRSRALEMLVLFLVGIALVAGAGWGGWTFRGKSVEPPAPRWNGEVLLGASTPCLAPRVAPDGKTLAFVTLVGGVSQVAVLSTTSGDWTVLTHQDAAGSVYKLDWSADGSKIYFDRVTDVPRGVFSVPAIGGAERLVAEDAQGPEALPDGSLLVVKPDAERNFQIHRFSPETGKSAPVGPPVLAEALGVALRAFADGKTALFWGRLAGADAKVRRIHLLDLASGKAVPFAPDLPLSPPIAVAGDGRSVLATLVAGDVQRVVSVDRDAQKAHSLASLTSRAWALSQSKDGKLYVGTLESPAELLRFSATGGVPERIATTGSNLVAAPLQLPDGRCVVPAVVSGKRRLLVTTRTGDVKSLLDVAEQASPPAALVGKDRIAFLSGGVGAPPLLAVATTADGRIVHRLEETRGVVPQTLAVSPDGATLLYLESGALWSVPTAGGAPLKIRPAAGFALDARDLARPSLVVQLAEKNGTRLVRTPLAGGVDEAIAWNSTLRLTPAPLSPGGVGPDGRIVVTVTSPDTWYRFPALLDPATGSVTKVPLLFQGDVLSTDFGNDGALLGWGVAPRSALWRFEEEAPARAGTP